MKGGVTILVIDDSGPPRDILVIKNGVDCLRNNCVISFSFADVEYGSSSTPLSVVTVQQLPTSTVLSCSDRQI